LELSSPAAEVADNYCHDDEDEDGRYDEDPGVDATLA